MMVAVRCPADLARKRPPRKRKVAPLEGPAIVTTKSSRRPIWAEKAAAEVLHAPCSEGQCSQAHARGSTSIAQPPANDARKLGIVTARRPGARSSFDVPDMRPTQPQTVRASSGGRWRPARVRQGRGCASSIEPSQPLRSLPHSAVSHRAEPRSAARSYGNAPWRALGPWSDASRSVRVSKMRRVLPASRPRFTIRFSLTLMVLAAAGCSSTTATSPRSGSQ